MPDPAVQIMPRTLRGSGMARVSMAFLRPARVAYIHPPDERALDEQVLVQKGREGWAVPRNIATVAAFVNWLKDELPCVGTVLIPGEGWVRIGSLEDGTLPVAFSLHLRGISSDGKRPRDSTIATPARDTTKRLRAIEEYHPSYAEPHTILGRSDPILVALRWLLLLARDGNDVDLGQLREHRLAGLKPKEKIYYPGVLAFLKSAAFGQAGLHFGGQGYRNLKRSDLQGFVQGEPKAPSEVKVSVKFATDKDPTGVDANALEIKQEADYLKAGIENTADAARIGCLFCRMDRFWVVKYTRATGSVQVTPNFPMRAIEKPQQLAVSDHDFVLMELRRVNECSADNVSLADVLPVEPSPGFSTLVAFVEQLQRMFNLPASDVRLVDDGEANIPISDLEVLSYGRKSVVVLRRSTSSVLKICLDAKDEIRAHAASDGHQNLRRLISKGTVSIGSQRVLYFLELEGYGEPFGAKHVGNIRAAEYMWNQAFNGLRHLHAKGVLHRDIKPHNMIIFPGNVLKINDYDVSCFRGDERAWREVVGTAGYQSPSDMSPYTEEDDILSLALSFYSAKFGVTAVSRAGRLHILREQLHPDHFPEAMRLAVQAALAKLGLDDVDDDDFN